MASNYLINVPKLKGRENYDEWVFAAENFLVLEGMTHCIMKSASPDAPIQPADDAKTKAKLILTIDSSLFVHIKNVKSTCELWEKLRALFDDSGFSRRISLLRHLISIRLEKCGSMTSYVTQIVETGQKLAGTGFQISDEWIGSLLLAGLPDKFSPMIMAIEHSGISITTDAIKTKLLDMETEVGESNTDSAFVTYKKHQPKKKMSMSKDGRHNVQNVSKSNVKNVRCYGCHERGHYRSNCPNLEKNKSPGTENERKHTNAFSAVFLNGNFNKSDWYIDSGASVHLTTNESWIQNASYCPNTKEIVVANQNKVPVLCSGNVQITTRTNKHEYDVTVENVLCVPSLATNLLSVSQLISRGNKVTFADGGCKVYNRQGALVAVAMLMNGVYRLDTPVNLTATAVASSETWHRRLGHVNSDYLNKMHNAVEGFTIDKKAEISKTSCATCCEGKQSRLPFPSAGNRSNELLSIVHTDVCGPMENASLGDSRYFIIFVDDYSRMTYIYFMKNKNEAFGYFKKYKANVENQLGKKIKILRSDNGREYCNKDFDSFLTDMGIIHQKTNPYTPEQNGLSERMNRTLIEKARCLLFEASLDKKFWAEATNTAVYLQNRTVSSTLDNRTPYELWTNKKPDVNHLRIFGSPVMVHIPKEKRLKWDKKSQKCILMGYSEETKGYRIYNPVTNSITTSRDVIILENELKPNNSIIVTEEKEYVDTGANKTSSDSVGDSQSDISYTSAIELDSNDETYLPSESEDSESSIKSTDTVRNQNLPPRKRKLPERYGFSNMCVENELDSNEISFEEALQGPERQHWLQAIKEELQCFDENKAWELGEAPDNATIVKCKWVLRKKSDSENNICYRARLVAKGYSQKDGIDYNETFSPVVRHTTLRLLFALSVQLDLETVHLDVKTAFLNGELEETIYMQKPEGFECSNNNKVLKLKKAIYGLKQSSRVWHNKVDDCLLNNGYKKSKLEPCLYTKIVNGCRTIVALYVDDFFIFSNDKQEMKLLKKTLSCQFKIKDLGSIKQCLGMCVYIDKENNAVSLSQANYIDQLLNKFNMSDCNPVNTPMEIKLNIDKSQNEKCKNPYQQLIGSLMYLAVLTRPDIAYAVGYLSQFNNCHNDEHWSYVKRILKYLKKTKEFGLKYCKNENVKITGYVDADWANNCIDRKSYTGFCFMLSGSVISWGCKKQKSVALSSTEAEYMAIAEGCKEAIYLRNLQYEITEELYAITVCNDNQSAHKLSSNPVFHNRTKHIDVRYHFCREVINNKIVKLQYLSTVDMPADLLTKSLNSVKHCKFMKMLGIQIV